MMTLDAGAYPAERPMPLRVLEARVRASNDFTVRMRLGEIRLALRRGVVDNPELSAYYTENVLDAYMTMGVWQRRREGRA